MYRSLMFKSNPLAQQFHRYNVSHSNDKAVKTLQLKNYSFLKIDEEKKKAGRQNGKQRAISTLSQYQKEKQKYYHNQILTKRQSANNKNSILYRKSKQAVQQTLDPFAQEPGSAKRYSQMKANKLSKFNNTGTFSPQKRNFKITSPGKSTIREDTFTSHNKNKRVNMNKSQDEQINMSCSVDFPPQKQYSPKLKNDARKQQQQRKNNILKSTLYKSIDLDSLFQKIESKVGNSKNESSNNNPQDHQSKKINKKIIDRLKRQINNPNNNSTNSRNPFDQFNLKFLLNKKKNIQLDLENEQNRAKGSNLAYFQSFMENKPIIPHTTRDTTMTSSKMMIPASSNDCKMDKSMEMIAQSGWNKTRRRKTSHILLAQDLIINEKQEAGHFNGHENDDNDLRMSIKKIANLKKQLSHRD